MSFNVTFNARSHYDAHQKLKLLAIQVESYGHIAEANSSLRSEIGRFVVQPIYG